MSKPARKLMKSNKLASKRRKLARRVDEIQTELKRANEELELFDLNVKTGNLLDRVQEMIRVTCDREDFNLVEITDEVIRGLTIINPQPPVPTGEWDDEDDTDDEEGE